jgi:beta-lactamase regulating signal transducer with metallopeptidase domain
MERLVTWLWQGSMLAVGTWGLLRVWRPNAATRYAIWWTTLLAMFVLLVVTAPATRGAVASSAVASAAARSVVVAIEDAASPIALLPFTLPAVPRAVLAIGVGAWLGLALIGLVQLALSVSQLQRMKRACRPFPVERERRLARWMAVRGEGRAARLCLCDRVRSASALGLASGPAIIALNASLLVDVDDEELDHIVLHEYAHIQRRDDWWHVLQIALLAVLRVHPAVIWIGRQLRLEREAACDDWVIDRTRMVTTYARCLMAVASFELSQPDEAIPAPGATGRRGDLTRRIERLLDLDPRAPARARTRTRMSAMPVAGMATALTMAIVGLCQLPPLVAMSTSVVPGVGSTQADAAAGAATGVSMPTSRSTSALDAMAMASAVTIAQERAVAPAPRRLMLVRADTSTAGGATGGVRVLAAFFNQVDSPVPAPTPVASRAFGTTANLVTILPAAPVHLGSAPGNANAVAESEEAIDDDVVGVASTSARRAWWSATNVGVAVGQSAANVGQATASAGVSVGDGVKRAGVATGSFFSRFGKSLAKVIP